MLADFIVEIPRPKTHPENSNCWTLNVDRVSRETGAGIGLRLKTPTRERMEQEILKASMSLIMNQNMKPSYPELN